MRSYRVLGITNSLRDGSLNRMALALAGESLPDNVFMSVHDLRALPLYDFELEQQGMPEPVERFARAVHEADGIVLCSPEYNHSIPAPIKNAIDWASRVKTQPFEGKPAALLSATPGLLGGARVQYELRRVLDAVGAQTMVRPEVFIGMAHQKFDARGRCSDDRTRQLVREQLQAFERWMERARRLDDVGTEQA